MLCAQALAVVARAAGMLREGERLEVLLNAEDVRHDLRAWAQERGDALEATVGEDGTLMQLTRRRHG